MSQEKTSNYTYKAFVFSFLLVGGFFIFQFIASLVMYLIHPGVGLHEEDLLKLEYIVVFAWFNLLYFLPLSIVFYAFIDKCEFVEIGFSGKGDKLLFHAVLGFVSAIIFFLVYIFVLKYLDFMQITIRKPSKIISILLFAFFSGLSEEVVFRGYLLHVFTKEKKITLGVLWTSFLFAVLHVFNPEINAFALINIFLLGIFLALTTIHTKNLYFAIMLHVSFNFIDLLSGFNFLLTENDFTWLVVDYQKNNELLTGGKEGITGSILLTGMLLISIILIGILVKKKTQVRKSA